MTLGRRSRYTPEIHRQIVEYAEKGIPRKIIAPLVGIGQSTLMLWLKKGREGEEPYVQLLADLEPAEQMLVAEAYRQLRNKVFRGDGRAVLRTLEAYDRERWARQYDVRVVDWTEGILKAARDEGWDADSILKFAEWLEDKVGADRIAEFLATAGLQRPDVRDSPAGDEGIAAEPDPILPE